MSLAALQKLTKLAAPSPPKAFKPPEAPKPITFTNTPPAFMPGIAHQVRQDKDIELWEKWQRTQSPIDLSSLLAQVNALIQREVNRWAGTLARPLLEAEGKRLAVMAFKTYKPGRGAALGTHVSNYLKKMSRISYSHQNVARLPENKQLKFHTYNVAQAAIQDRMGRSPTVDELADELGWSTRHLLNFQRDVDRQETLESGGTTDIGASNIAIPDEQDNVLDFVHHDLPEPQKIIFEHLTGYGGAKTLTNQQIMKKLKVTQGQYSYQKRLLVEHLENVMAKK